MFTPSSDRLKRPPEKTRRLAGFFIILLISGCSTLPPVKLADSLPSSVELSQTPFHPQEKHQCGPAALATILNVRQIGITPDELTPQIYLPERKGSLQIELTATARRHGMLAYPLAPDLGDLFREVAAGNPVLVLQNLAFDWWPQWHYAVVIGYDLELHEVILRSGREERRKTRFSTFLSTWSRSNNWALVILPPDKIPQTARPASYLKAAYDLEATDRPDEARLAYRSASEHWPTEKRAWLALGNSLFNTQEYSEAHAALKMALSLDPTDTTTWNNLAYVYLAAGCPEQAQWAIERALSISPGESDLLDSQRDVRAKTAELATIKCSIQQHAE
ncbi:MAG: PA2778 family cysteine peptidase [Pseudomonadota bacterium]